MAFPTAVNDQITDSVTQSNLTALGDAPAFALGTVYQSLAHAAALAMHNAVAHQQQWLTLQTAVTAQAVCSVLDTGAKAGDADRLAETVAALLPKTGKASPGAATKGAAAPKKGS